MSLQFLNTLTGEKQDFVPLEKGKVRIYNCGPTVYNYFHLGNARNFVVFDCLRRYLDMAGWQVTFVQNLTDVDDKIIEQAKAENIPASEVAKKYAEAYFLDADALGLMRANFYPRATDHIGQIIQLVERLIKNGKAYVAGGDVYFEVGQFKEYGKLSKQQVAELQSGARIEVNEQKKNPLDFTLWKQAKEGEPSWDSPWGKGRPGWHIECSAMSTCYLGETFDIHAGGNDLIFPHHENEIAQSEGATGKPFARYWLHNGLLQVKGERMGKSMGNFLTVRELLKTHRPATLRYFLLSGHYRGPLEYTEESLAQARAGIEEFSNTLARMRDHLRSKPSSRGNITELNNLREKNFKSKKDFQTAMDDDLNTPRAFAVVFELLSEIKSTLARKGFQRTEASQKVMRDAEKVLVDLGTILGVVQAQGSLEDEVKDMARRRDEARANRDWPQADRLRNQIQSKGYKVEDSPNGTIVIKNF